MKIKGRDVESTPFAVIDVTMNGKTRFWAHFHYTARPGTYGYQVCSRGGEIGEHDNYWESVTNGCGYSKDAHAFGVWLNKIIGKHEECDADYFFRGTNCYKGGNYYSVSLSALKKMVKV